MRRRVPDISRIQTLLGWTPRIPLDETLARIRDEMCHRHARQMTSESSNPNQ